MGCVITDTGNPVSCLSMQTLERRGGDVQLSPKCCGAPPPATGASSARLLDAS